MTTNEYIFCLGQYDGEDYIEVGLDCYEAGWIDDFGLVTPAGAKAITQFEIEG